MGKMWPAKDPDAVLDYVYTIPLDTADSVTGTLTFVPLGSTTVTVVGTPSLAAVPATNSDGVYGQDLTVVLEGGEDGELAIFEIAWVTAGGREDDDEVGLPIVSNQYIPLVLTDYAKPHPAHLGMRYPAFVDVPTATISYWLTDAERYVTDAWTEGDYAAGLMSLAAHNMALAGLGTQAAAVSGIPSGVKSFKSGSFSAEFTEQQANASASGSLESTRYGQEYAALLRRNRAGARVTPTGVAPTLEYPPYGGIAGF